MYSHIFEFRNNDLRSIRRVRSSRNCKRNVEVMNTTIGKKLASAGWIVRILLGGVRPRVGGWCGHPAGVGPQAATCCGDNGLPVDRVHDGLSDTDIVERCTLIVHREENFARCGPDVDGDTRVFAQRWHHFWCIHANDGVDVARAKRIRCCGGVGHIAQRHMAGCWWTTPV